MSLGEEQLRRSYTWSFPSPPPPTIVVPSLRRQREKRGQEVFVLDRVLHLTRQRANKTFNKFDSMFIKSDNNFTRCSGHALTCAVVCRRTQTSHQFHSWPGASCCKERSRHVRQTQCVRQGSGPAVSESQCSRS